MPTLADLTGGEGGMTGGAAVDLTGGEFQNHFFVNLMLTKKYDVLKRIVALCKTTTKPH